MSMLAVMDPPWSADAGGGGRGAQNHYGLACVDGIAQAVRMSGHWSDAGPALVWMWATTLAFVAGDAHALANRLGLRPCAGFVWAKVDVVQQDTLRGTAADNALAYVPPAKRGLGQWSRCEHEHLLLCRRGDVAVPAPSARQRSVIFASRGAHSAKPEEAWEVIEATSKASLGHTAGVEFFCRSPRRGWTGWGTIDGPDAPVVTRTAEVFDGPALCKPCSGLALENAQAALRWLSTVVVGTGGYSRSVVQRVASVAARGEDWRAVLAKVETKGEG